MTTYNLHINLNEEKQENFLLESPYFVSRAALMLSMQQWARAPGLFLAILHKQGSIPGALLYLKGNEDAQTSSGEQARS